MAARKKKVAKAASAVKAAVKKVAEHVVSEHTAPDKESGVERRARLDAIRAEARAAREEAE